MSGRKRKRSVAERTLRKQLKALPANQYEFGIFDGRMTRRVWRAKEALRSVGWLKHRNARGGHIYFRPAGTDFVLLDDATADALAAIRRDGLSPAAVIETSPENYQAWFRFPDQLGREVATCVAQALAERYEGDPGSADFRHLGRAAGFTNRKAKYVDAAGRYPRVTLVEAEGQVTGKAAELLAAGEAQFLEKEAQRAALAAELRDEANGMRRKVRERSDASAFFLHEVERIRARYRAATDASRAEAAAARKMALAGFAYGEVMGVLVGSADVRRRKAGHVRDYAERTVAWAFGRTRPGRP